MVFSDILQIVKAAKYEAVGQTETVQMVDIDTENSKKATVNIRT